VDLAIETAQDTSSSDRAPYIRTMQPDEVRRQTAQYWRADPSGIVVG
jgi:hypothetical protein